MTESGQPSFTRRVAIAAAAGLAAGEASHAATPARRRVPFDRGNPAHNLDAFIRITGSSNPAEEVLMHNRARVFSVVGDDDIVRPLFDMEGYKVRRSVRDADGSWRILQREVFAYLDLERGEVLETWQNPLTGEQVRVDHIFNDPVNHHVTLQFPRYYNPGTEERRVDPEPFVMPWSIVGNQATFFFDTNTRWKNVLDPKVWKSESTGEYVRVTESEWYTADLADLEDPDLQSIPYVGGWSRLGPWLPWMFMGGQPGHLRYRGKKTKLASIDQLNEPLKTFVRAHPRFHHAPDTWSEPNESSYESYARRFKPRR